MLHDQGFLGLPGSEFRNVADEGKFPLVLEIAGFTNHSELIGIEHIDGREGLVVHNRFVALVRTEGEGEKTANLRQSSPTVPDTEGRNSFGFSDACNEVAVAELVANYTTLIGQHIVIGRVRQPFGIDIDKPVAAAIIIHFDGIFRKFLRKLRLDACGNIKLCAPLCVVFDVKRDDHGKGYKGSEGGKRCALYRDIGIPLFVITIYRNTNVSEPLEVES